MREDKNEAYPVAPNRPPGPRPQIVVDLHRRLPRIRVRHVVDEF